MLSSDHFRQPQALLAVNNAYFPPPPPILSDLSSTSSLSSSSMYSMHSAIGPPDPASSSSSAPSTGGASSSAMAIAAQMNQIANQSSESQQQLLLQHAPDMATLRSILSQFSERFPNHPLMELASGLEAMQQQQQQQQQQHMAKGHLMNVESTQQHYMPSSLDYSNSNSAATSTTVSAAASAAPSGSASPYLNSSSLPANLNVNFNGNVPGEIATHAHMLPHHGTLPLHMQMLQGQQPNAAMNLTGTNQTWVEEYGTSAAASGSASSSHIPSSVHQAPSHHSGQVNPYALGDSFASNPGHSGPSQFLPSNFQSHSSPATSPLTALQALNTVYSQSSNSGPMNYTTTAPPPASSSATSSAASAAVNALSNAVDASGFLSSSTMTSENWDINTLLVLAVTNQQIFHNLPQNIQMILLKMIAAGMLDGKSAAIANLPSGALNTVNGELERPAKRNSAPGPDLSQVRVKKEIMNEPSSSASSSLPSSRPRTSSGTQLTSSGPAASPSSSPSVNNQLRSFHSSGRVTSPPSTYLPSNQQFANGMDITSQTSSTASAIASASASASASTPFHAPPTQRPPPHPLQSVSALGTSSSVAAGVGDDEYYESKSSRHNKRLRAQGPQSQPQPPPPLLSQNMQAQMANHPSMAMNMEALSSAAAYYPTHPSMMHPNARYPGAMPPHSMPHGHPHALVPTPHSAQYQHLAASAYPHALLSAHHPLSQPLTVHAPFPPYHPAHAAAAAAAAAAANAAGSLGGPSNVSVHHPQHHPQHQHQHHPHHPPVGAYTINESPLSRLLNTIDPSPTHHLIVCIEKCFTLPKREARLLTTEERTSFVIVAVRFLGNPQSNQMFIVAKDICDLLHIRKGNVAKSIRIVPSRERARLRVLCPGKNGRKVTHVLSALSVSGVKHLLQLIRTKAAAPLLACLLDQIDRLYSGNAVNYSMATIRARDSPAFAHLHPALIHADARLSNEFFVVNYVHDNCMHVLDENEQKSSSRKKRKSSQKSNNANSSSASASATSSAADSSAAQHAPTATGDDDENESGEDGDGEEGDGDGEADEDDEDEADDHDAKPSTSVSASASTSSAARVNDRRSSFGAEETETSRAALSLAALAASSSASASSSSAHHAPSASSSSSASSSAPH